jgi:hypothetical protein
MTITVTLNGPSSFAWSALDDHNSTITSGTGTSVLNAGSQALAAIKSFCATEVANFTAAGTNWQ